MKHSQSRESFMVVAESRTNNALRYIRSIGKLAYLFPEQITEEDTKEILKALGTAIRKTKKDFKNGGNKHQPFKIID